MRSEPAIHKHILFTRFPYESAFGGEEWHTLELAKFFGQHGSHCWFMGSCPVLLEHFPTAKRIWGGRMAVTPWQLMLFLILWPAMLWNMWRHLRLAAEEWNIEAVYMLSLNEKILLTPVAKLMGMRVTWVEHQHIRGWLTKSPLRLLYRFYSRHAEIIAIGKENYRTLRKLGIPESRLHDIPNGVSEEEFLPPPQPRTLHRETVKIGCITRLIPKKGVRYFIDAMKLLQKKYPHITAVIVGEGPQEERLKRHADRQRVTNLIFLKQLMRSSYLEMMHSIDILVVPSIDNSETFSIVAAEAMMLGIPAVVTRCSGIAGYVKAGVDAIIIPQQNPQAIHDAIERLITNKEYFEAISYRATITAQQQFSFVDMAEKYFLIITGESLT